jgi:hypothetical protein
VSSLLQAPAYSLAMEMIARLVATGFEVEQLLPRYWQFDDRLLTIMMGMKEMNVQPTYLHSS